MGRKKFEHARAMSTLKKKVLSLEELNKNLSLKISNILVLYSIEKEKKLPESERVAKLESENQALRDRVAELEIDNNELSNKVEDFYPEHFITNPFPPVETGRASASRVGALTPMPMPRLSRTKSMSFRAQEVFRELRDLRGYSVQEALRHLEREGL